MERKGKGSKPWVYLVMPDVLGVIKVIISVFISVDRSASEYTKSD